MRDSQGGISSLYFQGDNENVVGHIVVDCGFTKLFEKITEIGTARYIQNIAAWTAQSESKIQRGIRPDLFHPDISWGIIYWEKYFYLKHWNILVKII